MYAHCVRHMDQKERRNFDAELYGFKAQNEAGNDVLRDIRAADDAMTNAADS